MPLKKGDLIDEHKRHPDGCGLVLKVMGGGEGFEKVICCGHELTEEDVVPSLGSGRGKERETARRDDNRRKKEASGFVRTSSDDYGWRGRFQGNYLLWPFCDHQRHAGFEFRTG